MTATVVRPSTVIPLPRGSESIDLWPYLAPTQMCDADDDAVREMAAEVTRDARTRRDAAIALFYWVRDEIAYTMGDWNWRASQTLALRRGTCSNKANLMVAMARALGIPAGFHVQFVTTPSYFSGGFIPLVQRVVRDRAIHVYVTLFLNGRWVKCDPADDKALSDAIDAELSREARIGTAHKRMFAAYIAYMRQFGARYRQDSRAERLRIEADFGRFLADTEPEAYAELLAEPVPAAP